MKSVQPWKKVQARAKASGTTIHRATRMDLCHIKHYELDPKRQSYKGRVALRGDTVKDEDGRRAVWPEQYGLSRELQSLSMLSLAFPIVTAKTVMPQARILK